MIIQYINIFLFICTHAFSSYSIALEFKNEKTFLIQSPLVDDYNFTRAIKEFKNLEPISHYFKYQKIKEKEKDIEKKYFEARTNVQRGYSYLSIESFKTITLRALEDDWGEFIREIIFDSFCQLASLSKLKETKKYYLKKAILFAPDLSIHEYHSRETAYQFKSIKKSINQMSIPINLPRFSSQFSYVLINGFYYNLNKVIKLPVGDYRFTFISNKYFPSTHLVDVSQINQLSLFPMPLSKGECNRSSTQLVTNLKIQTLFPGNCISDTRNEGFVNESKVGLKTSNLIIKPEEVNPVITQKKNSKSWIWVAAGVILAGSGYYLLNKKSNSSIPPYSEQLPVTISRDFD